MKIPQTPYDEIAKILDLFCNDETSPEILEISEISDPIPTILAADVMDEVPQWMYD